MIENMEYALECIVWYDCHYEWLEPLADELEKASEHFQCPAHCSKWHTEKHVIWMLLVGMFGDWGTSIRSGWIVETTEAAKYIRSLCKKARGD